MRTRQIVASMAVLGGAFEVVNVLRELGASGNVSGGGIYGLAVAMSVLAGLLLAGAGVALFRRGAAATRVARVAAVACLALVIGVQLAFPVISIFARLIGIGIPIALLLVTRRGDPSVAALA